MLPLLLLVPSKVSIQTRVSMQSATAI